MQPFWIFEAIVDIEKGKFYWYDDRLNLKTQFNDLADHNLGKNIEFHRYPIFLWFRGGSDIADQEKIEF